MKQGAIFDMDGLMFDTERQYQEVWQEIAEEMGIVLPPQFTREISGSNGDLLKSIVSKYYHTDEPMELFHRVLDRVEIRLKEYVPLKPGLLELLSFLKENGVKLAVASSSYEKIICSNLKVSNTEDYFDAVVSGSGSGIRLGKPAPDIFLFAAEQIGLSAKDCYVFEDSINGVLAGLAAGSVTIMVPDYTAPTEEIKRSDACICASLSEALELIRNGTL